MAKIRHIAFRSEDVEATAALFHEVFDMEIVQRRGNGAIDLSDGDVNITVLPVKVGTAVPGRELRPGLEHIGFTVADDAEARRRLMARGAQELPPIPLGDVHYEAKYLSSEGLMIDIGHWAGTSPIDGEREIAEAAAGKGSGR